MSPPDKDLMPTIYDTMQPGPDHFEDDIARSTFAPLVEGMSPALEDLPEVHVTIPIREQPPTPVSVPPSECSSRAPTPVITKTCTPVITKTRTRALSSFKLDEVKNPSSGATVLATLVDSGGKPRHWVRGVCLVSGVLIVASVVWFLARLRATPTDTNLGICRTPGCKRHARLLLAPLNHSVDPCDDFSAFACSAWKPVAERSPSEEYETSTAQLATKRWFEGFQSALTTGSKVLPVGANALRMYQACIASAKSSTPSRIHDLRDLMRSLGIPWPARPKSGSPLGVLLQLALKWKVALWFRVRLLRTFRLGATEERRVVELSAQRYLLFDIKHHRHIMKSNSYASYWRSYHKVFTAGDRDVEAVSQDEINNSSDIQTDILEEWLPVIINPLPKPALLSVAELSKMASGVPETSEWTSQLTANLPEPAYGAEDRVLLRDVAILEALGAVLQRYNETDVLDHLGWHFAQCYGPVADASLLRARYGDEYAASLQSPIFCAVEVENVYEAVVTAMYAASRFDAASRETLSADLHGVVDAAKEIISTGSSWLDEGTRALVMRKLDGVGLALWPDDLLLKEVPGVSAYTWFPENTTSFWDLWVELRLKFSQISRDPEDKAVEALANHALPHFDYDYLGNRVVIAVAGLQEPFYYVDGTR
ncbi:neprilysin-1-like [Haemaphysalis longicornis]